MSNITRIHKHASLNSYENILNHKFFTQCSAISFIQAAVRWILLASSSILSQNWVTVREKDVLCAEQINPKGSNTSKLNLKRLWKLKK
jgi:hypothetical protein